MFEVSPAAFCSSFGFVSDGELGESWHYELPGQVNGIETSPCMFFLVCVSIYIYKCIYTYIYIYIWIEVDGWQMDMDNDEAACG
jgi:hypothetical protein